MTGGACDSYLKVDLICGSRRWRPVQEQARQGRCGGVGIRQSTCVRSNNCNVKEWGLSLQSILQEPWVMLRGCRGTCVSADSFPKVALQCTMLKVHPCMTVRMSMHDVTEQH